MRWNYSAALLAALWTVFLFTGCAAPERPVWGQEPVSSAETESAIPQKGAQGEPDTSLAEEPAEEPTVGLAPYTHPARQPARYADATYQKIAASILGGDKTVTLSGISDTEFETYYTWIEADPELFAVAGCDYSTSSAGIRVTWQYHSGDMAQRLTQARAAADEILAGISDDAGDYEKAKYVHDWLCENVTYQYTQDGSDQDIYGALVEKTAVCNGYCAAFQYLMERLGVETQTYWGIAAGDNHTWNSAVLDDALYYFDITWDDQEQTCGGYISYNWFAVTSAEMLRGHVPDQDSAMDESAATACNYYFRNGYVLETYDTAAIRAIFKPQIKKDSITLRCADRVCYDEVMGSLIEDGNIYQALEQLGRKCSSIEYTGNDEFYTLTVFPGA